jgi:hypothetical protein
MCQVCYDPNRIVNTTKIWQAVNEFLGYSSLQK